MFALRRSRFSISQTFWLESPNGDRSADIKVKWALLQAKLDVSLKNAASDTSEEIKGCSECRLEQSGHDHFLWTETMRNNPTEAGPV